MRGGDVILHGKQGDILGRIMEQTKDAPEAFRLYGTFMEQTGEECHRLADILSTFETSDYEVYADGSLIWIGGCQELIDALVEEDLVCCLDDMDEDDCEDCDCEDCDCEEN